MKRVYYYIIGIIALLSVVVGATWAGAHNGAVRKENNIVEATGSVHSALGGRYEKVGAFIDAIESANATVLEYLETIKDARIAFANAIANGNAAAAQEAAELVDGTFVTLVALLESNPESYNTITLYQGFMAEFAASTNATIFAINTYNEKVNDYNTHIQIFPNLIFLGNRVPYAIWSVAYYTADLPTFN